MADKGKSKAAEREKLIEQNRARLYSRKASERADAALWLGEAAADDTVADLVRVYQTDTNARVRSAAAYALGQFRALEAALAAGEQDKVEKLLHQMETQGKYGTRSGPGWWLRLTLGLLLSGVGLTVLALLLYGGPAGIQAAVQGSGAMAATPDRAELAQAAASLQGAFELVRTDVETLQQQFSAVLGGNAPECNAFYNLPPAFALPANTAARFPELATLATRLNEIQSSFAQAYEPFQAACAAGTPPDAASAGPAFAALRPALAALPEMANALNTLGMLLTPEPTTPPTATATPPPAASPVPAATAIPTTSLSLTDPRRYLPALYALIEELNGPVGDATLLASVWQEAATATGRPAACDLTPPAARQPFDLSEAEAASSPELAQAVDLINNGMELVRAGWTNFGFACTNNSTSVWAAQGQDNATAALVAFNSARIVLDKVSGM